MESRSIMQSGKIHPSQGFLTLDQLKAVSKSSENIKHNFILINHKGPGQNTGEQVEGGDAKVGRCLTHQ